MAETQETPERTPEQVREGIRKMKRILAFSMLAALIAACILYAQPDLAIEYIPQINDKEDSYIFGIGAIAVILGDLFFLRSVNKAEADILTNKSESQEAE